MKTVKLNPYGFYYMIATGELAILTEDRFEIFISRKGEKERWVYSDMKDERERGDIRTAIFAFAIKIGDL